MPNKGLFLQRNGYPNTLYGGTFFVEFPSLSQDFLEGYINVYRNFKDITETYYYYSSHFPKYLTAVISKLDNPIHRSALIQNLTEESGKYNEEELIELEKFGVKKECIEGIPHPILFKRFADSVGADLTAAPDVSVLCWREQFYQLILTGSVEEALGAIGLGTEFIVRDTYLNFLPLLESSGLDKKDFVFFPLHTAVDDHHQETLFKITKEIIKDESSFLRLKKGVIKSLMLRSAFWDSLLERSKNI